MLLCFVAHAKCENAREKKTQRASNAEFSFLSFSLYLCFSFCSFLSLTFTLLLSFYLIFQPLLSLHFWLGFAVHRDARHGKSVWRIALHGTLIKLHSVQIGNMAFIAVDPCGKKCLLVCICVCVCVLVYLPNKQSAPFARRTIQCYGFWHGVMDALH